MISYRSELTDQFTKRRIMRFLYGNNFKYKDTYKNMVNTLEFRQKHLPFLLNEDMKKLIDHGMQYIHGRDRCFCPIFVVQCEKITKLR